jgi:uncharacterized protein (TIGR03067 family)
MGRPGVPEAGHVELWIAQFSDLKKIDQRLQTLIDLGPQVAPIVNQRLKTIDPRHPMAVYLASVLRQVGDSDSIPILIDLLKRCDQSITGDANKFAVFPSSTQLAATSALWTLTGRQKLFTPIQWERWWIGVKTDYVVARNRSLPEFTARVTSDRVTRLTKDLVDREVIARERLLVLGPTAIPILFKELDAELLLAAPRAVAEDSRPMTQRFAWVIDELGGTDKLPASLLKDYFIRRFVDSETNFTYDPIETSAVCRALSNCPFADFCSICLATDGQRVQGDRQLRRWMSWHRLAFSRRFGTKPQFITGDPSAWPIWNKVTPAANPGVEIADAVPIIIDGLSDKSPVVRSCAATLGDLIGFCSDEKPESLIIALRDAWLQEQNEHVRLDIGNLRLDIGLAMCRFSSPIVLKALSDGLRSDRTEIVSDSAALMDWVQIELNEQTRPDFERLVELSRSEDDRMRRRAVQALGRKAMPLLAPELDRLVSDKNDEIRESIAVSLRSNPDPKFAEVLFKLADDSNEQVRIEALSTIGNLKHPPSMKRLMPLLKDKRVHGWAVSALASMGGKEALPLLMTELKTGNDVGGMIYQHLRLLTGEKFADAPEPWLEWWKEQPADKDDQTAVELDLNPFQGVWNIELCDSANKQLGAEPFLAKKWRWTVKGDEILWHREGEVWKLKLAVEPEKSPMQIDLTYLSGPFAGKKTLGIYEWGGTNGKTLKISNQDPGAEVERPKAIEMKGSGQTSLIFLDPSEPVNPEKELSLLQGTWTFVNVMTLKWPKPTGFKNDKVNERRWVVKKNEISWIGQDGGEVKMSNRRNIPQRSQQRSKVPRGLRMGGEQWPRNLFDRSGVECGAGQKDFLFK